LFLVSSVFHFTSSLFHFTFGHPELVGPTWQILPIPDFKNWQVFITLNYMNGDDDKKSKSPTIILVEDNVDDASLTLRAFRSKGLDKHITYLRDGEQAIDFIFNNKEVDGAHFTKDTTVILLDLHMPRVSGQEVLEKIKSNPVTKDIPVVILTSSDDDPSIEECKALGANHYIVKPVTPEGFLKVVTELGWYWSDSFRF
jgi:CheY-like chemotaxis protein